MQSSITDLSLLLIIFKLLCAFCGRKWHNRDWNSSASNRKLQTFVKPSPSGTRGDLDLSRCLAIPLSPFGLIASNNKIANDTSGIIKSRTSKDRQCNSKKWQTIQLTWWWLNAWYSNDKTQNWIKRHIYFHTIYYLLSSQITKTNLLIYNTYININ
jgi:hypothetical protein